MLIPPYIKSGVCLSKIGFLACCTRDGWAKLALHRLIWDLG